VITAAALCPAPPLLARPVTGADPVLPELRQACLDAVTALVRSTSDLVAVIGADAQTRRWDSTAGLNLAAYAPGISSLGTEHVGVDANCGPAPVGASDHTATGVGLPLSVGLGGLLLDQAGYRGRRYLVCVGEEEPAARCAALGRQLAEAEGQAALLVMADGSARRGLKAPGYLDERSFGFDAEVERAIRAGNLAALLALDQDLARDLMATGRPAWQVLAGAMNGRPVASQIWYCGDPFGVAYLVASLTAA
jgi:hypothetical protein